MISPTEEQWRWMFAGPAILLSSRGVMFHTVVPCAAGEEMPAPSLRPTDAQREACWRLPLRQNKERGGLWPASEGSARGEVVAAMRQSVRAGRDLAG